MAERGVSLYRRTCDRSLLPICCPRPFQVSYLLGMLRATAGVVIGLSNRQATDTAICRHFEDGSDGTRTRDLQRDRPLRASRRRRRLTRDRSVNADIRSISAVPRDGYERSICGVCCPFAARPARPRCRPRPLPNRALLAGAIATCEAYPDRTDDPRPANPSDSPTPPDDDRQERRNELLRLCATDSARLCSTAVRSRRRCLNGQRINKA